MEIIYHYRPHKAPVLWIACIGKERRTTPNHQVTTEQSEVTCQHCRKWISASNAWAGLGFTVRNDESADG